jgi:putative salt-induced outer membrane protein YdiY
MPSRIRNRISLLKFWVCLVLVSLMGWGFSQAQSVVLHLRNGDRITGQFVSETTNSVVIATPFSERVSIPSSLIERRENVAGPAPGATNQPAATLSSGVVSQLVLTNKPTMTQAAGGAASSPQVKTNLPPKSMFSTFLSQTRGEVQLGANLGFSSKDREAFTGHIKLTHNYPLPTDQSLRNIFDYDVAYGTTDNVLSDNRMEGTWKTEYDFTKRFLLYNIAGGGYDEIRGIDLHYDFGPGVGYKWVVLSNFVFRTELGGNYQEQYLIHQERTTRYSLRLEEEMWWQLTPKIRWDEKAEFFPDVLDSSQYRVRLETNLSYLLKQNLTLTLNVIELYDTAVPAALSKNDLEIRSLLGIKF